MDLKTIPLLLLCNKNNCSFAVFKILRQSDEALCINIAALKPRAIISFFYAIVLFPGFRTQITITAAVAMRNSANTTGFPIISVSWKRKKSCSIKHTAKKTRYTAIEYRIQAPIWCCRCSRTSICCCCVSSILVFTDKSSISDDFGS